MDNINEGGKNMGNEVLRINDMVCMCDIKQLECATKKRKLKIKDGFFKVLMKLKSFNLELYENDEMRALKEEAITRTRWI